MTPESLLAQLPPFRYNRDIIIHNQQTRHIIKQVLRAHELTKNDYDLIAGQFAGGNVPKKLFEFCKKYLPYKEEKGSNQTTRTPGGILELAKVTGGGIVNITQALLPVCWIV